MKNILALIGLLVVGFGGAGWYLGWYKVNVTNGPDGTLRVQTDVNTKQAVEDLDRARHKVGDFLADKTQGGAAPQTTAPVNTPGPLSTPATAVPQTPTTPQPAAAQREGGFFSTLGRLIDDRSKPH